MGRVPRPGARRGAVPPARPRGQGTRRAGLADEVVARGSVIERAQTLTAAGRLLSEAPLGEIGRRAGAPSVCVHRADVQQVLAAAAGAVHLGAAGAAVLEDAGGVMVDF